MTHKLIKTDNYLLVVDDSLTVGKGYALNTSYKLLLKYNTDQHLLYANDIVKKIIAHLPLNGSPILEGVPLLPPYSRHQEDGIDDAVIRFKESWIKLGVTDFALSAFSEGYNKAREKYKYTEEDLRKALLIKHDGLDIEYVMNRINRYPAEFECEMEYYYHSSPKYYHDAGFVKCDESQYNIIRKAIPECETNIEPKTITTAQGKQWVGKYK